MLVRFLSYAASLIGARRYKPLLISCLVVLFSVTGISMVVSTVTSDSPEASSKVGHTDQTADSQQSSTNPLNGLENKSPKDNQALPNNTGNQNTNNSPSNQQSNVTPETPLELTVNTATLTLSQGSPAAAVTISTERTNIQWTLASDNSTNGPNARVEPAKDNTGNAVLRFTSDNSTTPGTYLFTVTAKDAVRNQTSSKIITVTVN
jgi:uncharacterized protein (UPF0333 family)